MLVIFEHVNKHIKIILVNPSHPGNIGASARAMKTMGLTKLILVQPNEFPSAIATAMAAGADDLLAKAQVVTTVDEALKDSELIFGTSARLRAQPIPLLTPRELAPLLIKHIKVNQIAIMFGRESSGLTNGELAKCHYHIHIPVNPHFSSLNLASAVQVICYELSLLSGETSFNVATSEAPAPAANMQHFILHLKAFLSEINFSRYHNIDNMMIKLQHLFNRAQLTLPEIQILEGIISTTEQRLQK